MNVSGQKPKSQAIRSTPAQFALLKAAYAVSYAPSTMAIVELSQQTGLPEKWITSWFGRQRTKSRKNGDVIDMTMRPSVFTSSCNISKTSTSPEPVTGTVKQQDDTSVPPEFQTLCSSSPVSADQGATLTTKNRSRKSRRPTRANHSKSKPKTMLTIKPEPREEALPGTDVFTPITQGRAPQLLPSMWSLINTRPQAPSSVVQSRLPVPPAMRSGVVPRSQLGSIYPKNTTDDAASLPATDIHSTPGCFFVPLHGGHGAHADVEKDRGNLEHQKLSEAYIGPPASSHIFMYPEPEFQQALPVVPLTELVGSHVQSQTHSSITPAPLTAQQGFLQDRQAFLNVHSQAFAAYIDMYNKNPAVHRAMLMNYAAHFPALFPAMHGAFAASGPSSNVLKTSTGGPPPAPSLSGDFKDTLPSNSPGFPRLGWNGGLEEPRIWCDSPNIKYEAEETPWQSNSNYLDFSGLHCDYAPLSHLQERLQPFRLPESEYLFGREAVVNHLLDERLGAEEPFQAAMGLVLLSKLGLQW